MMWVINPITLDEAQIIVRWSYSAPYDVYNIEGEPVSLLIPSHRYHSVQLENELIGFFCLGKDARVPGGNYDQEALDIGLGMRPDLTGQGLGSAFFKIILDFIPPSPLRLTVATFNERAKRLYERAGFRTNHTFLGTSGLVYVQMVRPPTSETAAVQNGP